MSIGKANKIKTILTILALLVIHDINSKKIKTKFPFGPHPPHPGHGPGPQPPHPIQGPGPHPPHPEHGPGPHPPHPIQGPGPHPPHPEHGPGPHPPHPEHGPHHHPPFHGPGPHHHPPFPGPGPHHHPKPILDIHLPPHPHTKPPEIKPIIIKIDHHHHHPKPPQPPKIEFKAPKFEFHKKQQHFKIQKSKPQKKLLPPLPQPQPTQKIVKVPVAVPCPELKFNKTEIINPIKTEINELDQKFEKLLEDLKKTDVALNDSLDKSSKSLSEILDLVKTNSEYIQYQISNEISQKKKDLEDLKSKLVVFSVFLDSENSLSICSSFKTCGTCAEHPDCGWCPISNKCVDGTKDGPLFDTQCTDYSYDSCTADTECSRFKTCSQCITDVGCAWCDNGINGLKCIEQNNEDCPHDMKIHLWGDNNQCPAEEQEDDIQTQLGVNRPLWNLFSMDDGEKKYIKKDLMLSLTRKEELEKEIDLLEKLKCLINEQVELTGNEVLNP